ncbi:MAG: 1-acyl-sn-glycerol-3-phosphate acyltransferase [Acidiferrobacterales bacterium]|nr:1-acyl-sn-glycerol-3-phosphate acyltransferase [Acidiferrobacterales bacterium]
MWQVIGIIRLLAMVLVLLIGVILSFFIFLMSRKVFLWILSRWYRSILWILGIRVLQRGEIATGTTLIVANHVSWADILVIGSRIPHTFLAMKEVINWPVIGKLAARAGTLFIERGRGAPQAIEQVAKTLLSGCGVVIFPEGRTSDGARVNRFHPRIFEAAVRSEAPVVPIALVYRDAAGDPPQPSRISFAESGSFMHSVWKTASGPSIDAEMRIFAPIEGELERQQLSKSAYERISGHINVTFGSPNLL